MKPFSIQETPTPIRSQEDVPHDLQETKLTVDDAVHIPSLNLWIRTGDQFLFGGELVKISQIIRKAPFEESDDSWGIIALEFLLTRKRLSYVFSPTWAQHLVVDHSSNN